MKASSLLACLALASQVVPLPALAHGEHLARYGGVVESAKDITYELVAAEQGMVIHVEDHGDPVPTAGTVGRLVVTTGSQRAETPIQPAGGNRLLAKGVRVGSGQQATVLLTMPSGRVVVLQYPKK